MHIRLTEQSDEALEDPDALTVSEVQAFLEHTPHGNTSVLAGILPSNASDAAAAAEDPRAAYLDSCRDLAGAIGSLEAALVSFTGKEDGVKGQVFAKTRSRLEKELSESSSMIAAPPAQPRQA